MTVIALFQPYGFAAKVCFVANQCDLARIRPLIKKLRPQGERITGLRGGGVDHQQHSVGLAYGLERALDANLFHMVVGGAQTGSIDDVQRHAIDVDMFTQDIPRSACNVGDDCRLTTGQLVQQARFTCIRSAGDHHRHAITKQRTLPGLTLHGGQLGTH
ncbi:hypothetical protein D3C81_1321430 [compost metagenome]